MTPGCRKMQFPASGPVYPFTAPGFAGPALF